MLPANENANSWKTSEIEVVDGTLHFKNYGGVNSYLARFSQMTEEEIVDLENSMNFVSFRSEMNRSAEEFDHVITKEEFENWKDQYSDILYMQGDEVTSRIPIFSYEIITNREREYFVGEAFHKVTRDKLIIILDGDKSKLPHALTLNSSSPEQKILINHFPKEPIINTRDHEDCNIYHSRIEMEKNNERKVYLDVSVGFAPINEFLPIFTTRTEIRVHGRKRRLWGWHRYKTQLAFREVSYQLRDHDGNLHIESNLSGTTNNNDKYDLYVWPDYYGTDFNSTIESPPAPYFESVKGKAISRGVLSLNRWAVLCCNYSTCPSSTPVPTNPFIPL